MDDEQLLREYVVSHSETAFRALVERYAPLVYGAALRQLENPSQAEDVAQAVFIVLARKAEGLPKGTVLSGWLYRATRFIADKTRRAEYRRYEREREAVEMRAAATDADWTQLAPVLDEAMAQLRDSDRTVILLRFFENKSLKDVGQTLGISEDTAQKRVSRAIGKLRELLVKQGVTVSATTMTATISTHAASAVPTKLGTRVAGAGLGKETVSTAIQNLAQTTLPLTFLPRVAGSLAGLVILITGLIFWHHFSPADAADSSPADFTPGVATMVVRVNGGPPAPAMPDGAATTIRFNLTGTSGVRFDAIYSHDGETRTVNGVLPAQISFQADAFKASITIHGPGQFGYEIYRDDRLAAKSGSLSVAATNRIYSIEDSAGGFRFSVK